MNASRRYWLRFSLRTMLVIVTLVCWVANQLTWIRERRALLAEERAIFAVCSNYATGCSSEDLEPLGSATARFVLPLFGESSVEEVYVFYSIDFNVEGMTPDEVLDKIPKLVRARRAFPEAKVVAVNVAKESDGEAWQKWMALASD